jgi:hypothetical protein
MNFQFIFTVVLDSITHHRIKKDCRLRDSLLNQIDVLCGFAVGEADESKGISASW